MFIHFLLDFVLQLFVYLFSGLKILASTCDQVAVNAKAVHQLMGPNCEKASKGGLLSYVINGTTIIHCFDPPHLIKGIRNNLITKTLKHHITERWSSGIDPNPKVKGRRARSAKWDHVDKLYRLNLRTSTKFLLKIGEEHIKPKKLKMKVCVATQIFSKTCGENMLKYAANNVLPSNYSDTGEVLLFFNDVFDSMNGSCEYDGKSLKGPVTENSVHFDFWEYALKMLSVMQFIDKATGKSTNRTAVLKHFQSTIKGYIEICRKCLNLKMTKISLRYYLFVSLLSVCMSIFFEIDFPSLLHFFSEIFKFLRKFRKLNGKFRKSIRVIDPHKNYNKVSLFVNESYLNYEH